MPQNSQGHQANLTGDMFEKQVINRIKEAGYVQIPNNKTFIKTKDFITAENIFTTHCYIGESIYNTDLYADIILFNKTKYPNKLAIEIKWQQRSGSVDEKYPYLVMNIKKRFPCPAIIVIDGAGYKTGALEWLKAQIDEKLKAVFNTMDFLRWANSGGL